MWATRLDPDEWTLEIPEALRDRLWRASQTQGNAAGCWTAYLNRLCIAVLENLWNDMEMGAGLQAWPSLKSLASIWEVTTGSALTCGDHRLVIVPTEAVDASELSVPQEWVDIPKWVGDYYVSAQIDPPAERLQILGYVTHQQLKSQGEYDAFDRTYSIDSDDLIAWDAFQPSFRQYRPSQTQVAVPALSVPEPTQAEQLIQRLGVPELLMPRLAVPFAQWGALLENDTWREQLSQQRQGGVTRRPITNLLAWLQEQFEPGWQELEALRLPEMELSAIRMRSPQSPEPLVTLGKQLMEASILLSVSITPLEADQLSVVLRLDPTTIAIEAALASRIIDKKTEEVLVEEQASSPRDMIQLQLTADPGDRFDLEITLGDETIIEQFEL